MKTFEASDTRELKIDDGSFHLYLSKNQQANAKTDLSPQPSHAESVRPVAAASTQQIKAPLVGTVYLQAKPDGIISAVKVKNGELVEVDQPLFEVTEG